MLLAPLILLFPADSQVSGGESPPLATEAPTWSTSLDTFWTEPPDDDGYLSAILSADRGALHLEARWAYEGRDTASFSVGHNFEWEGDVSGSATPMIGYAFGETDGVVPAVSLELSWKALTFTTDVEYLIATSDESDDFLYSWSELSWTFADKFLVGLVGQRTNVFDQELTIDRGFFVGAALGRTYVTAYVFNPDQDDPYVSVAVGASF
jgi:hypothetical protein